MIGVTMMDQENAIRISEMIDCCDDRRLLMIFKRLCDYRIYCLDHPGFDEAVRKQLGYIGYECKANETTVL